MSGVRTMDGNEQAVYTSPRHAAVWFLNRSRKLWKEKYQELKKDQKLLRNRVADVTRSREKWRSSAEISQERICELERENAALREQCERGGKSRPCSVGPRSR